MVISPQFYAEFSNAGYRGTCFYVLLDNGCDVVIGIVYIF